MKKQFLSFFYAFRGIWDAVCTETHLRFHLTAAFYVLLLSPFFELNAAQYGVLILLIAAVISAELFNTSLETVCDLITKERSYYIRIAKDISAAAVLVSAPSRSVPSCSTSCPSTARWKWVARRATPWPVRLTATPCCSPSAMATC